MTIASIKVPSSQWVDIYDKSGIAPGTQVIIQNLKTPDCYLVDNATEPSADDTGYNLLSKGVFLTSATTPTMLWATSPIGSVIQVEEA